jgi:hypothetical protein
MRRSRLVAVVVVVATLVGMRSASAFVVTDPANTIKNLITAALENQVVELLTQQGQRFRRMARRLSAFADLSRYIIPDVPRWRSYRYQDVSLYAVAYEDALNLGDPGGLAYEGVVRSRTAADDALAALRASSPVAANALAAQLATLDLADSTLMTATDANGQLRSAGKREMRAVDALERDAADGALTQGTSAVLDKISAAALLETRQKQSRLQFLTAIIEQLAVDNKRSRDTEAAALNMQLARLRIASDCGESCPGLLSGSANALRTWRQP